MPIRRTGTQFLKPLLLLLVLSGATTQTFAQTAEQMRIINQLPPSQREQALTALRQMQSSAQSTSTQSSITEPLTGEDAQPEPIEMPEAIEPVELRADAGSRVVISLTPKLSLTAIEKSELGEDPVLSRLQGSQFYELDNSGVLRLPGLNDIALLGLNDEDIVQRLSAEPALADFDIFAVLLDSRPIGVEALKPFGYEILTPDTAVGLEPAAAGPVPPDYVLGPGDSIRVQLFGNVNGIYEFEVSRDGVLNLPELGPITVAGLPFSEFRSDLNKRVQEMLIGTQVSVTMGQLRTIRVFVLGDANRPGSYVVSSLATMSSALYRSGGISEIGTLRNIQLKRQGKVVARLDLYDLLLQGDTSGDERLQPGDVIFIPPIGETIAVAGAVRRPAIYELRGKASVADAIQLAGGLSPDAYPAGARLERIDADSKRIVVSVDAAAAGATSVLSGGDTLTIPQVLPELNNSVLLAGHVQRPGAYQWQPGMRLTDLISSLRELAPGADANYLLIRREAAADRSVHVASANLQQALAQPESAENPLLQERDTVHVFSVALGRQRVVKPIMEELILQARFGEPYSAVHVEGHVRAPGVYPLEAGMRVSDLIRAGGSMAEGAYALDAELTRYAVVNGEYRTKEIVDVALAELLNGNEQADILLSPHDYLKISLVPDWQSDWSVMLEGELKFPGVYQIRRGETLLEVIERAGGLTDNAFPEGAVFLRASLKEREREQIEVLIRRMETDLAALSLETLDTTGTEALTTGQALLDQLRNTEPVGRLVIDVATAGKARSRSELASDLELKDGDRLLVPTRSQEVTVLGEAQYTTSHLYQAGLARDDYIALSGGLTRKADKKQIYVVRASGAVVTSSRSRWFGRGANLDIRPGDSIVIPLDTNRIRPLTFWGSVTQILYQGAIAVAAVKTFDN